MKNKRKPSVRIWKMHLLCVGLCFYLAGCAWQTRPPNVYQVELHHSESQTLRLVNNHTGPIVVHSFNGNRQMRLETGDTLEIKFMVVSIADMRLSESNPWYVIQNTTMNYAQEQDGVGFLKASGTDVELDIKLTNGQPDPLRLSLQNCPLQGWEENRASAAIHTVNSRAMAGVPQRICPQ
jgi:hypothetical protein